MQLEKLRHGTELIKRGFASMQKGGVIMDVTTPEEALIAERVWRGSSNGAPPGACGYQESRRSGTDGRPCGY